ncbi:SMI1/KNR4 family protein [Ferrimonas sediminicola]|uniref:SMI1/KNR4 family protein n=1 Tax=Ferrimonas sediminicola TaxID=2569538 RepID=A0A4U1BGZ9_9GAMM|nr:SMI1/KNR4 family protein [Ferrimonas sediminicola]TKB50297.1 SMI1/KNR4 family protein [Ferrimonas sediminicola]
MKLFTDNRKLSILHKGEELVAPDSKLSQISFAPLKSPLDRQVLYHLETSLGIRYPQLIIDFLEQCGGYEASTRYVYPSALGKAFKPIGVELRCPDRRWFFDLSCFQLPEPDPFATLSAALPPDFVQQNETLLRKLVPLAWDNGFLLCLDFSRNPGEPAIAFIDPKTPVIHPMFLNFIDFVLRIGYLEA